jgi:hypothetical protein
VHDVRDPIFAQLVADSDGGALLEDPRFAHVNDLSHPDIQSQVECARRRLALIQLEINDLAAFWWQEHVITHNLRNTVHAVAPTWRQFHVTPVLQRLPIRWLFISMMWEQGGRLHFLVTEALRRILLSDSGF